MKILIVNQHISFALGGSETQCDLIAKGLSKRGHDVLYAAVGGASDEDFGYRIARINPGRVKEFSDLLDNERPDVIYWRYNKNNFHDCALEAKKRNIPFVFALSAKQDVEKFGFRYRKKKTFFLSLSNTFQQMRNSVRNYRGFKYVSGFTTVNSQYLKKAPVKNKRKIWSAGETSFAPFEWDKKYFVWVANFKTTKRPEIYLKLAERIQGDFRMEP